MCSLGPPKISQVWIKNFIEHRLNIDASVKPRRQKLRQMSDDKVVAVKSEV
jgi:hypothetical protein